MNAQLETIQQINEIYNGWEEGSSESNMSGYEIITDKQRITLLIDNEQNCCEEWGYFMSQDNFEDFIGAHLLDVKLVDHERSVESLSEVECGCFDAAGKQIMFVTIETTKGTLQFTAYNEHNGYYTHEARVTSTQLAVSKDL